MVEKETLEEMVLEADDIDGISEEEMEELNEKAEEFIVLLEEFSEDVDQMLAEINDTEVYKKLGFELHMDLDYQYYMSDRSEE